LCNILSKTVLVQECIFNILINVILTVHQLSVSCTPSCRNSKLDWYWSLLVIMDEDSEVSTKKRLLALVDDIDLITR